MANEAVQNMESALEYEKSCQARADIFYQQRYPGMNIWRPTWGSHRAMQQADIDVCVGEKEGWPNELKISEKFRTQPWDDILIELYTDIEDERPGWSKETAADWHFFFHEHKWTETKKHVDGVIEEIPHDNSFVRMVPTWVIRKLHAMCLTMYGDTIKDMHTSGLNHKETILEGESVTLIRVPTKVNGKVAYWTGCTCVPVKLIEKFFNIQIETQSY